MLNRFAHVGRTASISAGVLALALVANGPTSASAAPDEEAAQPVGTNRLVSRDVDGKAANGSSSYASVSDDGRFVAFHSIASDLVADASCADPYACNYVHDRQTGETVLVSVSPTGEPPNHWKTEPDISGDGRYVAYASRADNLVDGDRNRASDVFVYDRQTGMTELVSRNPDGEPADSYSTSAELNSDGRYVVYESSAKDLVPGDNNHAADVFRTDRATGTTIVVSVTPSGARPRGESNAIDVSADGRIVVYRSLARNIVPGDDNDLWDVFAYDTETGTTELVSRTPDGTVAAGNSGGGSISDDGRFIAVQSRAPETFWCRRTLASYNDVLPP